MSWATYHTESEKYASEAELAHKRGDVDASRHAYRLAAEYETKALNVIDPIKSRTMGITAVSATSLWFKAGEYRQAEKIAYQMLATDTFPKFAQLQLQQILQAIWHERASVSQKNLFGSRQVVGILRGLHLDNDWLEIQDIHTSQIVRIRETGDEIDDVVGKMVNHAVVVDVAVRSDGQLLYKDIQPR